MEAHGTGPQYLYDRVKQALHLHTDRGSALREAALAVRKGGVLSVVGIYGLIDKFPFGVLTSKGITVRTSQQPGQRYMRQMLEHVQAGDLDPAFLITHRMSLEDSPRGYEMFKKKHDRCVRVAFRP
jgi:threonine dehydrogenase-like Zn-dependent dehydrogenase